MNRSLARRITLALPVFAALCGFASNAGAVSLPDNDPLTRIFGGTALVTVPTGNEVKAVNLRSGKSTRFETPINYFERSSAVLENGFFAGTTRVFDQFPATHEELFISGPDGLKTLGFAPSTHEDCHDSWHPLRIDERGRATALHLALKPTSNGKSCSVVLAKTRLVRFNSNGSKQELYLPNAYKPWLTTYGRPWVMHPTFVLSGDRLAVFKTNPRNRVAVLNLRAHRASSFATGGRIVGVEFAGPKSLLVKRWAKSNTFATHFSVSGRAKRTTTESSESKHFACGRYTATTRNDAIVIRNERGKVVYRKTPANNYTNEPLFDCSSTYLYYRFQDEGCSRCGQMPVDSKLIELATLPEGSLIAR